MIFLKAIARFLKAFMTFLQMYRLGFSFSGNIHKRKDKGLWGFYRLTYLKKDGSIHSLYDIDMESRVRDPKKNDLEYFHARGEDHFMNYNYKDKKEEFVVKK